MRGIVARVKESMGDVRPRSDLALVVGVVLAGVMVLVVVAAVVVAALRLA